MMAGLTREQRAAKAAALEAKPEMEIPTLADLGSVKRETSEAPKRLMDAKEHAARIMATRKPFNGLEKRLDFDGQFPGWKLRWVNEDNVPGRQEEGYIFVGRDEVVMSDSQRYGNEDTGDRVSKHAGRDEYGNPYKTYLMKIPQEIATLLTKEKSYDQIAKTEYSIRHGQAGGIPQGNTRVGAAGGLPEIKLF